jgi:hypothetical protein
VNVLAGEEDMNNGNSLWTGPRRILALHAAHHSAVSRLISVLVIALLLCVQGASVKAEQVTFAFDAIVTDIADPHGLASSLPFQPAIGQHITGSVTFTPVPFSQTSSPDASLEIALGGELFAAYSLPLVTANDVYFIAGPTVYGPNDGISVACNELEGCAVPDSSLSSLRTEYLGMGLSSRNEDVIVTGEDLASSEVWNRLPVRRLTLQLAGFADDERLTIGADVGLMRLVPEPTSAILLVFSSMLTLGSRFRAANLSESKAGD